MDCTREQHGSFGGPFGEAIQDLKGGSCDLEFKCGPCSFPSPQNFSSNCQCECSCSACPPCPPRPVESCLSWLHQKYTDFYPDCRKNHLPICYQNVVEHDDLYLPPPPLSSFPNSCNRPTSSRSWSPPSPLSQQHCHCGTAQYQSAQVRPGSNWNMHIPELKPCFQSFQGPPGELYSKHPNRSEPLYIVETPPQTSPKQPRSRSTSPAQPYLKSCLSPRRSEVEDYTNASCQCSPRIDTDSGPKSFHTEKSGASSPLSPYNPELSPSPPPCPSQNCPLHYSASGFPEPPSRPLNRLSYAAELVTVEKHGQRNGSPRLESADYDESYTRRPASPHLHDTGASICRALSPESSIRSTPDSTHLEGTSHQNPTRESYTHLHYPTLNGSRSQSPSRSSTSTAQHRNAEAEITTFANDVKQISTSDAPPRLSPTNWSRELKQDCYSKLRSTLKPEFPSRDYSLDWKRENFSPMDFFSRVKSTSKSFDFSSCGRTTDRRHDFPSRDDVASSGRQDCKQEYPSGKARIRSRLEATDWQREFPSRGNSPSNERNADRKRSLDYPSNPDMEHSSGLRTTNRKQHYSSCQMTTEQGSSPIIMSPKRITGSGAYHDAETEPAERPATAPTLTNPTDSEAPRQSRPLYSENGLNEAAKQSSTHTSETNISSATEPDEDYRYGPIQAIPKAAESRSLLKPNFNKQDKRFTNREAVRRRCCGMCKGIYSRSHFATKWPFCANMHSCCCGRCSCPFPSSQGVKYQANDVRAPNRHNPSASSRGKTLNALHDRCWSLSIDNRSWNLAVQLRAQVRNGDAPSANLYIGICHRCPLSGTSRRRRSG